VVVRESDLPNFYELFSNTVLYGSTFFLGLLLGVLCEANTILNPVVLKLLVLGILALLISGIGGILGGYVRSTTGRARSTTRSSASPGSVVCRPPPRSRKNRWGRVVIVLPHALGANISGVITSAIFRGDPDVAFLLPLRQRGRQDHSTRRGCGDYSLAGF
jgi:Na+-transporting methylmalonyl-CoA/oxaloacetate decarboxylase beta subunit